VFGFVTPGIDNFGHMGGLIAGTILGFFLTPRLVAEPAPDRESVRVRAAPSPPDAWISVPGVLVMITLLLAALHGARI